MGTVWAGGGETTNPRVLRLEVNNVEGISGVSVWALFAVVIINTLFIAGLAVALFLIHKKMEEALAQATPLVEKATQTLEKVEEATGQLRIQMDQVLDKTTELVNTVSERVDTTTAVAEEAVTEPLIGAASLFAGINRGFKTYTERSNVKGDGR